MRPQPHILCLGMWCLATLSRASVPLPQVGSPLTPVVAELLAAGEPARAATLLWASTATHWVADGRLDPAVTLDALEAIYRLDPAWEGPWIYAGLMLQTQGDGPAAIPLLSQAAEHFPSQTWFPAALGVAHLDQGELEAARAWLDEARGR